ncbi:UDP-N-acetylmuramate dehydrogenase [Falcatimonas sp. MSJ-15]|uniref:UDP-N-acetylmuramate dehydrogenase n=1 Tax=Falcatimonas sp. MSJ-15 TaxID=2841515 RepID=UPI001C11B925|nr:UDP-N-acetylmuramate dehydrogenase [Falcatimonas sp. MSJ-15]MBU5470009.1 UDP-N-acetylmuramate dehydrogenase [Falcatimonas sp. MSJ-15]
MGKLIEQLVDISGEQNVLQNEPMKRHTTFRIGGPCDIFIKPGSIEEIRQIIEVVKENKVPYYVVGNGSNLLVSDDGYRGVIINLFNNFSDITVEGNTITASAGALLGKIGYTALKNSLTGFEFATGIPGTLGGAVVMNAGAYGGEMKDVLSEVTVLTKEGELLTLKADELELGYRTSIIAKKDYIVLEGKIQLKPGEPDKIKAVIDDLAFRRRDKQPLEYPSAGSTFKRPKDNFAGKLIMDAGLRGYTSGGAMVSDKHCGFVINKGDATCEDVIKLTDHVKEEVKNQFGIELELEVKKLI